MCVVTRGWAMRGWGPRQPTVVAGALSAFFLWLPVLLISSPVAAATITVTTTADELNANGQCSLREAVINANNDDQSGSADCAAGAGADLIMLQSNQTYTLSIDQNLGDENSAAEDDLDVTGGSTVAIFGNNSRVTRSATLACTLNDGNATGEFRIFHVHSGGALELRGVTLDNGCADGPGGADPTGGGVLVGGSGTLVVSNSTISGNLARSEGGGVATGPGSAIVVFIDSVLSRNRADVGIGGGISNGQGVTLNISRTTLVENEAEGDGGGIWNNGNATIIASTVAGNRSDDAGGGVYNNGQLTLRNSTISHNDASGDGGGLFNSNLGTGTASFITVAANTGTTVGGIYNDAPLGNFTVRNSIVGNNSQFNCGGNALSPSGANLATDTSCAGFTAVTPTQLNLGPLANYGGPTETRALFAGSVAIDGVPLGQCTDQSNNSVTIDQRGIERPQGMRCDVGAYETQWGSPAPVPVATFWGLAALGAALAASGLRGLRRRAPTQ